MLILDYCLLKCLSIQKCLHLSTHNFTNSFQLKYRNSFNVDLRFIRALLVELERSLFFKSNKHFFRR